MKIRSRWLTKAAAFCAVAACRMLFATCRKKFIGDVLDAGLDPSYNTPDAQRYVLCVWHDALLLPTFACPESMRKQCCCLVSKHQDGSYLAEAMACLDYTTVRGSSQRGGAEALRQLISDTAGMHIIFTPDGPRGPRRQMKQGPLFVAAQTNRQILPGAFVAKSAWRIRGSWTDLVIPMPFTTIYLMTGAPIAIPADVTRDQLSQYLDLAQQAMDQLNEQADRMFTGHSSAAFVPRQKKAA
ncbi:lysophospholipid acyltransferase family protein [Schlesneria paludicola]|uniref:lysophospholipid acyltransferase family protein n=1 Tax=Schlesneria paludicola TaxID=360056 RepID=UPI000492A2AB|nr:lysophospholipid acyltransferase family protein [Schlesneria paludicola]